MIINSFELIRLNIPFRTQFSHASGTRTHSDTILVKVKSECGAEAWGEILARHYVTGETQDEVMTNSGPKLARSLLLREFSDSSALLSYINEQLENTEPGYAVFSGFELALWNLFSHVHESKLTLNQILGPAHKSSAGHCITIGFETELAKLRHSAIQAKLSKATVVKVKVGSNQDAERLHTLNDHLKNSLPIRLDANSCFSLDEATELLRACSTLPIQSIEQPFKADSASINDDLHDLYAKTGIAIVADESVCTLDEARCWAKEGLYQIFNVRVGKCGGLIGTQKVIGIARQNDIQVVAGTMVGETAVLNQASKVLLSRNEAFDYVEGLNQHQSFLSVNPVEANSDSDTELVTFSYNHALVEPLVVSTVCVDQAN